MNAGRPFRRRFYDLRSQRADSLNRQVSGQSVTQDGRADALADAIIAGQGENIPPMYLRLSMCGSRRWEGTRSRFQEAQLATLVTGPNS
jgi:hypothetical protein